MYEAKTNFEIKNLGVRITANSTQEQLISAVNHNPKLLEMGFIVKINKKDNGTSTKKISSESDKESGTGKK